MTCPCLPDYRDTPLDLTGERGERLAHALHRGWHVGFIDATVDVPEWRWTQRDINELINRGLVKRHKQRPIDNAWTYTLTTSGRALAETL